MGRGIAKEKKRSTFRKRAVGWITYVICGTFFPALLVSWYNPYRPFPAPLPSEPVFEPRLSAYDPIILRQARKFGLDWRLVASMISVESSFRHDAVSPAGALGLMQIMPIAAREQGASYSMHPEENIRTGVSHFVSGWRRIKGKSSLDALKLSLAAYNVGLGHLRDAQNLAVENDLNPRSWDDVSQMLPLLEIPDYYADAKYGYCQGQSAVDYVSRVMSQYRTYQSRYPSQPVQVSRSSSSDSAPRT
jgi:membrane-bound lytic murein transglycosylase F